MAVLSVIQPRNPHRWHGFKTVFEEVEGHREASLQEGKRSGQSVERKEEVNTVVAGGNGGGWGGGKIHLIRQEKQSYVVRKEKNNEEGIYVGSLQNLARLRTFYYYY